MKSNPKTSTLIDITMPALGADMRDGTLIEWHIQPGESVEKGDVIAVVETNKGAIDMEAYHSGTISELLIKPETKLPVGSVLARMITDDPLVTDTPSVAESRATNSATSLTNKPEAPSEGHAATASPPQQTTARLFISPAAHRQANKNGINIIQLQGSGPQGAILLRDLPAHTEHNIVPTHPKETTLAMSGMRQAISDAMSHSKQDIPHYYLSLDINLTTANLWLTQQNQLREPEHRLLLPAILIASIARQLPQYPALNGFYIQGQFTPSSSIHIGNTISLRQGGLVVPALRHANTLTINDTMAALRDQIERSRHGHLRSSELNEATITVTSIGERGADSITGIIYPPQVAIIGLGRLRQTPMVTHGQLAIGDVMTVTLAADHRVSDGLIGARFLHALAKQLQHPEAL